MKYKLNPHTEGLQRILTPRTFDNLDTAILTVRDYCGRGVHFKLQEPVNPNSNEFQLNAIRTSNGGTLAVIQAEV